MPMTNQQAFDKAYTNLMTMKERAGRTTDGRFICMYAAPNGTSCAIGCLLPRDLGEQLDAGNSSWADIVELAVSEHSSEISEEEMAAIRATKLLQGTDNTFLQRLQEVHDNSGNWIDKLAMHQALEALAEYWHLTCPEHAP